MAKRKSHSKGDKATSGKRKAMKKVRYAPVVSVLGARSKDGTIGDGPVHPTLSYPFAADVNREKVAMDENGPVVPVLFHPGPILEPLAMILEMIKEGSIKLVATRKTSSPKRNLEN